MDLQHELCKHGVTKLKRAYALVQDLDALKLDYTFRSQNHQAWIFKSTSYQYPHQVHAQTPTYKIETKDKSVKSNAKGKNTIRDFFKCYKCQNYGHVAAICPTPVRVAFNKLPATNTEPDQEESIYQAREPEDSESEEEITGDNIEESSTSSPLETILVITEFTDIFPKNSTLILLEVTHVITKVVVVFSEDLRDKLPSDAW